MLFNGFFDPDIDIKDKLNQIPEHAQFSRNLVWDTPPIRVDVDHYHLFIWGRIYNIPELCKIANIPVEDSPEALMEYLLRKGRQGVGMMDGEFTFIMISPNETNVVRDRHGAGPQIYYTERYFGAFLKNMLQFNEFVAQPRTESLFTFLSIGYSPSPLASLRGVKKQPAGSVLTWKKHALTLEYLCDFHDFEENYGSLKLSEEEATKEYQRLHIEAIKRRIKGKKSVGLLLSGGYDSGGNIDGLREVYDGDAYTYSIGFKDNPWTELPLAKIMSDVYKTNHFEYEINGTEVLELPEIIDSLGDPFQEGGLMVNYTAMKLVTENFRPDIILGGDGNDQHFGTAAKELALHWRMKSKSLQPLQKLFASISKMGMFDKDNILFRTAFHNDKILDIQKSDNFGFKRHQLKSILNPDFKVEEHSYLGQIPKKFKDFDHFYMTHNYLGDIRQVIDEVILFKASKMAQHFNNDLSFPYMDAHIYSFLKKLDRPLKCKGSLEDLAAGKGITKFLHKNYLESRLPKEITQRKKQGGFAPLPIFFKDDAQRKEIRHFIEQSDAAKNLFRPAKLKAFLDAYDKQSSKDPYWFWYKQVQSFRYFNLLVLSVWWERFINNKMPNLKY